jgi:hypothetical protein
MNNRIWRQGDLLFEKVDKLPSGFAPAKSNVLLRGEATGHSHRLENGTVFDRKEYGLSRNLRREIFISVGKNGKIVHEEHATLILPWGIYKIIYQREYSEIEHTPAGWIWVGD